MGPTRASEIFLARNEKAARFRVTLYGSLSATGRGHFTDQAITDILGADRTEIVWSEEVKPFHPNGLELEPTGRGLIAGCATRSAVERFRTRQLKSRS